MPLCTLHDSVVDPTELVNIFNASAAARALTATLDAALRSHIDYPAVALDVAGVCTEDGGCFRDSFALIHFAEVVLGTEKKHAHPFFLAQPTSVHNFATGLAQPQTGAPRSPSCDGPRHGRSTRSRYVVQSTVRSGRAQIHIWLCGLHISHVLLPQALQAVEAWMASNSTALQPCNGRLATV